jgi:hypothetical protein
MCQASAKRARLLVAIAPINSTAKYAAVMLKAMVKYLLPLGGLCSCSGAFMACTFRGPTIKLKSMMFVKKYVESE